MARAHAFLQFSSRWIWSSAFLNVGGLKSLILFRFVIVGPFSRVSSRDGLAIVGVLHSLRGYLGRQEDYRASTIRCGLSNRSHVERQRHRGVLFFGCYALQYLC